MSIYIILLAVILAPSSWAGESSDRAFAEAIQKIHVSVAASVEKVRFEDRYGPGRVEIVDLNYGGFPFLARTAVETYTGAWFKGKDERAVAICARLGYGAPIGYEHEWVQTRQTFNFFDAQGQLQQVSIDPNDLAGRDEASHARCLERADKKPELCQYRATAFTSIVCRKLPEKAP